MIQIIRKTNCGKLRKYFNTKPEKYDMTSYLKNRYMMCISFGLQCGDIKMYYVSQVPVAKYNKKSKLETKYVMNDIQTAKNKTMEM